MKALFAGTFDPPTLGHADLILRAAKLFEKLYVAIALNSEKKSSIFSISEKKELLQKMIGNLSNVEVREFSGLAVDFAQNLGVQCLLRGIRNASDLEFECQMASANRKMTGIETFFLMANESHLHISSSLIREIAQQGRRLHGFVPAEIEDQIFNKFASKRDSGPKT